MVYPRLALGKHPEPERSRLNASTRHGSQAGLVGVVRGNSASMRASTEREDKWDVDDDTSWQVMIPADDGRTEPHWPRLPTTRRTSSHDCW